MSDDPADVVRRGYEAFASRDLDATEELIDPAFELHLPPTYPDMDVLRGREGIETWLRNVGELWEEWRFEDIRITAVDELRFLGEARLIARGRQSEVPLELDVAHIWTVRAGRIVRGDVFHDQAAAREALGLDPAEASQASP